MPLMSQTQVHSEFSCDPQKSRSNFLIMGLNSKFLTPRSSSLHRRSFDIHTCINSVGPKDSIKNVVCHTKWCIVYRFVTSGGGGWINWTLEWTWVTSKEGPPPFNLYWTFPTGQFSVYSFKHGFISPIFDKNLPPSPSPSPSSKLCWMYVYIILLCICLHLLSFGTAHLILHVVKLNSQGTVYPLPLLDPLLGSVGFFPDQEKWSDVSQKIEEIFVNFFSPHQRKMHTHKK